MDITQIRPPEPPEQPPGTPDPIVEEFVVEEGMPTGFPAVQQLREEVQDAFMDTGSLPDHAAE